MTRTLWVKSLSLTLLARLDLVRGAPFRHPELVEGHGFGGLAMWLRQAQPDLTRSARLDSHGRTRLAERHPVTLSLSKGTVLRILCVVKPGWTYILSCSDGTYYTGSTSNLALRLAQHQQGSFDGYTRKRRPVELAFAQEFADIRDAIAAERQIKGWCRAKKEALIAGDFDLLVALSRS